MKAALFSRVPYSGPAPGGVWPVPPQSFSPELAEHHYVPFSLTPNPMVMAGALTQRNRTQSHPLRERIELGQILRGSPATVLKQACTIREQLGAGILDLSFEPVSREKSPRAIELFGAKVLPRLQELP